MPLMTSKRRAVRPPRAWPRAAGLIVLLVLITGAERSRAEAVVTVSAAVSLTESMEAMARAYAAAGGGAVRFNFAASNVLSRQIVSGAPVDLFVSADESQMDVAARAGAIDAGTRVQLLGNRLAILTRPGAPAVPDARALLAPGIRRIAIGDAAAVPAGVYARHYLERIGIWAAIQPRLIPVSSVRAALAAVDNGSVDAAFTYATDAPAARRARVALVISGEDAPAIVYSAAIVTAAANRAGAERLLAFLRSERAAAIFARAGFLPLSGPGH